MFIDGSCGIYQKDTENVCGDRLRCLPAERQERMQRVLRGGSSGIGANCRGMGKGTYGGSGAGTAETGAGTAKTGAETAESEQERKKAELHDKTYELRKKVDHTPTKEASKTPEQKRTNKDVLLAAFPRMVMDGDVPVLCPRTMDRDIHIQHCAVRSCDQCRHEYWLSEVEK